MDTACKILAALVIGILVTIITGFSFPDWALSWQGWKVINSDYGQRYEYCRNWPKFCVCIVIFFIPSYVFFHKFGVPVSIYTLMIMFFLMLYLIAFISVCLVSSACVDGGYISRFVVSTALITVILALVKRYFVAMNLRYGAAIFAAIALTLFSGGFGYVLFIQ